MVARERRVTAAGVRLAVRLHDVSGDLAVGIALLKGWKESGWSAQRPELDPPIGLFEQVLADLRGLSQAVALGGRERRRVPSVRESLELAAKTAGIDLELKLTGQESWMPDAQAELVCLTGLEAIRNVKRHSGVTHCRLTIDLTTCPFVMTARDWGAGIRPQSKLEGGVALLDGLAHQMGAAVKISSQPGLGVELALTGPRCVLTQGADRRARHQGGLRSVVADESLGSRKRVASRRPTATLEQQIT